jgi:hypothetical protein
MVLCGQTDDHIPVALLACRSTTEQHGPGSGYLIGLKPDGHTDAICKALRVPARASPSVCREHASPAKHVGGAGEEHHVDAANNCTPACPLHVPAAIVSGHQ